MIMIMIIIILLLLYYYYIIITSSNQRLGVRSVVLWKYASVELIIFMWTAEVQIY